jgi:hypothetical protein
LWPPQLLPQHSQQQQALEHRKQLQQLKPGLLWLLRCWPLLLMLLQWRQTLLWWMLLMGAQLMMRLRQRWPDSAGSYTYRQKINYKYITII